MSSSKNYSSYTTPVKNLLFTTLNETVTFTDLVSSPVELKSINFNLAGKYRPRGLSIQHRYTLTVSLFSFFFCKRKKPSNGI